VPSAWFLETGTNAAIVAICSAHSRAHGCIFTVELPLDCYSCRGWRNRVIGFTDRLHGTEGAPVDDLQPSLLRVTLNAAVRQCHVIRS
jgi:hypothetical protein